MVLSNLVHPALRQGRTTGQPAATDAAAMEFVGKGHGGHGVALLAHFPPRLPKKNEIRIALNHLIVKSPAGPIASAHAPPPAQRMSQQHQAPQGHPPQPLPLNRPSFHAPPPSHLPFTN